MSDTILLISLLNLPSLRNTQKCLSLFGRIGLRDERVRLVLSRYLPNDEIPKDSIEGILNCPVFFAVPNDYPAVIASVNRGKLLRETSPDKDVTKSFRELSEFIVSPPVPQDAQESKKRGLFERIFTSPRRAK
jgi:pilus assembly protein CpaE